MSDGAAAAKSGFIVHTNGNGKERSPKKAFVTTFDLGSVETIEIPNDTDILSPTTAVATPYVQHFPELVEA